MPPIRLPAASSRFPCNAAETVIATSGRLPASERKMSPPMSSPRPSRASSASVVFESIVPAAHVAAAPPRKITRRSAEERPPTSRALVVDQEGDAHDGHHVLEA